VLDTLYTAGRDGSVLLVMSTVNLAEVLIHTAKYAHAAGVDPVTFLTASGLRIHPPDEAIARRGARLETSRTGSPPPPRRSSAPAFIRPTVSSSASSGECGSPSPTTDRAEGNGQRAVAAR
jgi:hypothetical protein